MTNNPNEAPRFYAPRVEEHGDGVIEHPLRQEPRHWSNTVPAAKDLKTKFAKRLELEQGRAVGDLDGMGDTTPLGRISR